MDFYQFDPTSVLDEFNELCEEMYVKQEENQNEGPTSFSPAALLYAKQITPNVLIDITGTDPITIKTDPDRNKLFPHRRAAIEKVPKKPNATLRKPMKPLVHRCVGRIFGPSHRRQNAENENEEMEYANEREMENIANMEQDEENELPAIIDTQHIETQPLNLDYMANRQPVVVIAEPEVPPIHPSQHYCHVCRKTFAKTNIWRHNNKTKIHLENLLKAKIERDAANTQNAHLVFGVQLPQL